MKIVVKFGGSSLASANSLKKLRILFTQTHTEDLLSLLHRASVFDGDTKSYRYVIMGAMIWQKPARILMVHWQTSRPAMMKLLKDLGWI